MKLAFGHRPFSEKTSGELLAPGKFVRQREAHGERQSAADNRVATVKACRGIEQMHRSATAAAAAFHFAVHLRHDRIGR